MTSKAMNHVTWIKHTKTIFIVLMTILCIAFILPGLCLAQDTTPPTTTLSTDPINPNGQNGWFITAPTITLTRNEPGTTYYQWDATAPPGDPSWIPYSTPFNAPEGQHILYYYSVDTESNTETTKSQVIKVDTVLPQVDIWSPPEGNTVNGIVSVEGAAIDPNFSQYILEYGAGTRPAPRYASTPFSGLAHGTWWRTITSSTTPVPAGTLASWDTTALDNSFHTLRLIVKDEAGNTSVRLRRIKTGNSGRPNLEEVTIDPLDVLPDITADGQKIAFTSDKLGNFDTWLMNADGTNLVPIPLPSDDRHPSLSPDGQQIVFQSDIAGNFDIWKINVDGTGLTQLTNSPFAEDVPTWSHDGQKIVYASDINGDNDIFIMNQDGTSQTNLTVFPADDWLPDISPDGTKIAFHSNRAGNNDIWIMNSDGTGLNQITIGLADERHPSFSSDGQRITFQSSKAGNMDIWTINIDGTNLQRLTDDPAPDAVPTWSPDGSKIVFASGRSGLCDIYSMEADGSSQQRLTFSNDDLAPDIAYDSSKIAFQSNRARNYTNVTYEYRQGDIFVVNSDGTSLGPITNMSFDSHHPSFSPDGQELVCASNSTGNFDIWKMKLDGTGLTELATSLSRESVPTWGPNDRIVYVSDLSGNDDIFIMNQDGSSQIRLTVSPATDRFPDLSTDGQKVAFSSNIYGPGDVFVMNSDGSGLTQVTTDPGANEWHPSFNPSGDKVTFVNSGPNTDLYMINIDGTNQTRLSYDQAVDTVNTWGADGKTVVFSTSRTTGDGNRRNIWKMTFEAPQPPTLYGPASSNDEEVKLYGTTSANAEVRVYDSVTGEIVKTTADGQGNYHATVTLAEGSHTLTATATLGENTSDPSVPLTIVINPTVPAIGVAEAHDNEGTPSVTDPDTDISQITSFSWRSFDINIPVTNNPSSVTALINGSTYTLTDLDGDGVYSLTLTPGAFPPGPGAYEVVLTVTDSLGNTYSQTVMSITLIDPSGYVYDANLGESARIQGATVTLYTEEGIPWDAGEYGQINPQITDSEGRYGWNVPAGSYYVTVAKDGYYPATSYTVTVPPPVLDLNIALKPLDTTPPGITISSPASYGIYPVGNISFNFSATDDLSGIKSCSATLDEGTAFESPQTFNLGAGVYNLMVTAEDNAGNVATKEIMFVVYDPTAGFVTGGGWIIPDFTVGKKATFGFVSKYVKGTTMLSGNLEFQYSYENINLKSTAMQWLVISNNSAIFQGTGTINGNGLYTYRVDATDGDQTAGKPDHFKITIWQGSSTEGEPIHKYEGDLAGGSIIVHKK